VPRLTNESKKKEASSTHEIIRLIFEKNNIFILKIREYFGDVMVFSSGTDLYLYLFYLWPAYSKSLTLALAFIFLNTADVFYLLT